MWSRPTKKWKSSRPSRTEEPACLAHEKWDTARCPFFRSGPVSFENRQVDGAWNDQGVSPIAHVSVAKGALGAPHVSVIPHRHGVVGGNGHQLAGLTRMVPTECGPNGSGFLQVSKIDLDAVPLEGLGIGLVEAVKRSQRVRHGPRPSRGQSRDVRERTLWGHVHERRCVQCIVVQRFGVGMGVGCPVRRERGRCRLVWSEQPFPPRLLGRCGVGLGGGRREQGGANHQRAEMSDTRHEAKLFGKGPIRKFSPRTSVKEEQRFECRWCVSPRHSCPWNDSKCPLFMTFL